MDTSAHLLSSGILYLSHSLADVYLKQNFAGMEVLGLRSLPAGTVPGGVLDDFPVTRPFPKSCVIRGPRQGHRPPARRRRQQGGVFRYSQSEHRFWYLRSSHRDPRGGGSVRPTTTLQAPATRHQQRQGSSCSSPGQDCLVQMRPRTRRITTIRRMSPTPPVG